MWNEIGQAIDELVEAASINDPKRREFEVKIHRRKLVEQIDNGVAEVRQALRLEMGLL